LIARQSGWSERLETTLNQ